MGTIKPRKKTCSRGKDCCGYNPCQRKKLKSRAKAERTSVKKLVIELDKRSAAEKSGKKKKDKKDKKEKKDSKEAAKAEKEKKKRDKKGKSKKD